jgi:uncharacterized protein YbjQ (UPF0145 family)
MLNEGNKMKTIIIFSSIFLMFSLLSCSTTSNTSKQVITYVYDFRKYTDEGFLFTTEKYLGDYESIGLISVEIIPELRRREGYFAPGQTYAGSSNSFWYYIPISPQEVLDSLYSKAKGMGADAVINLDVDYVDVIVSGNISVPATQASGFAIKRKGAFK